ncbi:MAG: putative creatinine amidohydrolase [Paenibacillus sp.]|jgi:creatinine amidohydrolase|uniref:creatininase family protein n=1 Tax=Paenibacillus sp. GCM10012303 TaxID=3317340 RepID=UPI0029EF7883|nr:putative creatinine amidohydrolase [Paenibacillus sp.]
MLSMNNTRRDIEQAQPQIAVLPVGALEQHGSHLPIGTDSMIAAEYAEQLAQHLDAFLLPTLAISSSIEHRKAIGTVYLRADTLALVIRDIADSLYGSGFKQLLLVNGHGGNYILKPAIRQLNRDYADRQAEMEVVLLSGAIINAIGDDSPFKHPGSSDIHAGEKETSLIMHLRPDLVRQPVPGGGVLPEADQSMLDYLDMTELCADGYWGYPDSATPEKGRLIAERFVPRAIDYLEKLKRLKASLR